MLKIHVQILNSKCQYLSLKPKKYQLGKEIFLFYSWRQTTCYIPATQYLVRALIFLASLLRKKNNFHIHNNNVPIRILL